MNIRQKDLVLLPFPFSDLQSSKVRPALVVSNDSVNDNAADCIMVPLTSVIKDEAHSILIRQGNLATGKLVKPSRIRVDKIFTVEKRLVKLVIGHLNDSTFEKVRNEISKLF